jgi:biotin carboxyl carrier protein
MTDVVLPSAARKDVEPGTEALVDKWLVQQGDRVKAGQTIAVVVLVKTNFDIVAPIDAVVEQILVPQEATFKPGQSLARLKADL